MILTIITAIFFIAILIRVYFVVNKRMEQYEDTIKQQSNVLFDLHTRLQVHINKIREIDNAKIFASDDEVGVVFKGLVNEFDLLNSFLQSNINADRGNEETE